MPARAPEWRAAARGDLFAIIDHISDDNETAAPQLKNEIESKIGEPPHHPTRHRPGRIGKTDWP